MIHTQSEPEDSARVLVALLRKPCDLERVRTEGWYRVPMAHLPAQFSADYLAFYQTAAFGAERWAVRYYAPVLRYLLRKRVDLLPDEPKHPRAQQLYYRVELGPLEQLPLPVPAERLRRVTFISTTFGQLCRANDVRELFHPYEDADLSSLGDDIWGAGLAGKRIH